MAQDGSIHFSSTGHVLKFQTPKSLIDCVGVQRHVNPYESFLLSPRERENRDRRDSRGDERDGQGKRNRNESEETEEIKKIPLYPYPLQG